MTGQTDTGRIINRRRADCVLRKERESNWKRGKISQRRIIIYSNENIQHTRLTFAKKRFALSRVKKFDRSAWTPYINICIHNMCNLHCIVTAIERKNCKRKINDKNPVSDRKNSRCSLNSRQCIREA